MSNKIVGKGKVLANVNTAVRGRPGMVVSTSVDIDSLVNRSTLESVIDKYLKNGFDWNKWSLPIIAYIRSKDREYLLDGDHRRHMHKICFPQEPDMDVWRIEVEDEEEYHRLFADINKRSRKNASGEETFVHEFRGGETEALVTAQDLIQCSLSVFGSPDHKGTVGKFKSPSIKVSGFRNAIKLAGAKNVKLASKLIQNAYPLDTNMRTELLGGLAVVYATYPKLSRNGKVANEFRAWFVNEGSSYSQKSLLNDFKKEGGAVHKRAFESIAAGTIKNYHKLKIGTFGSGANPASNTRTAATNLKKVEDLRDSRIKR